MGHRGLSRLILVFAAGWIISAQLITPPLTAWEVIITIFLGVAAVIVR